SGKLIAFFAHQNWTWHGTFSPDGARILTACSDNTAKLWDAATGKLLASFDHEDMITDAAFSPDGTSVVSLNYVEITSAAASASLARRIFSRILRPDARQTYFFGFRLRSAR